MPTAPRDWIVPACLAAAGLIVHLLPALAAELIWVRVLNADQPWRLVGAHIVHLDGAHLALNVAGLTVCWALIGAEWKQSVWAVVVLPMMLAIGAGLILFQNIDGYVGMSGLIHGFFAFGLVGMWRRWQLGAAFGVMYLVGKAAGEWMWPDATIAQAHWLGTAAGIVLGIMATFLVRRMK